MQLPHTLVTHVHAKAAAVTEAGIMSYLPGR